MINKVEKSFLGHGWAFPPSFDDAITGVQMVSEIEDIRQSLMILISTTPGERIMTPAYGCDLNKMVFERITESTRYKIIALVERAILLFEPRITVNKTEVKLASVEPGILHIIVDFSVIQSNTRSNIVYPFYLNEGTHVDL